MCKELNKLGIQFFRHPHSNIITIKSSDIRAETAAKFGLVPDKHDAPEWYKIVVMEHVTIEKLESLINDIQSQESIDPKFENFS